MKVYKHSEFAKWAQKENLSDGVLLNALDEIKQGLVDANLGGGLYKKRVAVNNKGKSGGVRILLAYQIKSVAFFIYGFAKNDRDNISASELKQLKMYAQLLLSFDIKQLSIMAEQKEIIEVYDER